MLNKGTLAEEEKTTMITEMVEALKEMDMPGLILVQNGIDLLRARERLVDAQSKKAG